MLRWSSLRAVSKASGKAPNNLSKTFVTVVERVIEGLFHSQNSPSTSKGFDSNPLENFNPFENATLALSHYRFGDLPRAIATQCVVVDHFAQSIGSTSDSFVDLGGSLNDLAAMYLASGSHDVAIRHLKRGLLMAERSYRPNFNMTASLLSNIAELHRMRRQSEESLVFVDRLLSILGSRYCNTDAYFKEQAANKKAIWSPLCSTIYPACRVAEFHFMAGKLVCTQRHFEEGLFYFNKGFEWLAHDTIHRFSSHFTAAALTDLSLLHLESMQRRGRPIASHHIVDDNLIALSQKSSTDHSMASSFAMLSPSGLNLSSSPRELLLAAASLTPPLTPQQSRWFGCDPEMAALLERVVDGAPLDAEMLSSSDWLVARPIMGVAFMDVENHVTFPLSDQ